MQFPSALSRSCVIFDVSTLGVAVQRFGGANTKDLGQLALPWIGRPIFNYARGLSYVGISLLSRYPLYRAKSCSAMPQDRRPEAFLSYALSVCKLVERQVFEVLFPDYRKGAS